MSWYLANTAGVGDQFASGAGLVALRKAAAPYASLMQFIDADAEVIEAASDLAALIESENEWIILSEGWVTIDGTHVFIGAGGFVTKGPPALVGKHQSELHKPVTKSDIAKLAHKGGKKEDQDIAESTEKELEAALRVQKSPNNKPFDLYTKRVAIEVKTKTIGTNNEISIKRSAAENKARYVEENPNIKRTYLLIVDKRPKGIGSSTGETRYFVKAGYGGGTNRMAGMTQVSDMAGIKRFMKL